MLVELDVLDVLVPLVAAQAAAVCTAAVAEAWHEAAAAAAEMSVLGPVGLQTEPADFPAAFCQMSLSQEGHRTVNTTSSELKYSLSICSHSEIMLDEIPAQGMVSSPAFLWTSSHPGQSFNLGLSWRLNGQKDTTLPGVARWLRPRSLYV